MNQDHPIESTVVSGRDALLLSLTANIVSAQLARGGMPSSEVPTFIGQIHDKLAGLGAAEVAPVTIQTPAVNPKKSIHDDFIICLEDGKKFKSLKRHLHSFGLTPDEYRAKWGLDAKYPMVAPAYAAQRSELAKKMGLGRKPKGAVR